MKPSIYLDYAAATPLDDKVQSAMEPFFSGNFYNPSATYTAARQVSQLLGAARSSVANWFGAKSNEIIFTAGGTEANNLAIHGIMSQYPDGNIVVSAIEHESVLAPAHYYDCREVGVLADGSLDLEVLERVIDDKTVLVSIMYANNEIGTIQPINEIAKIVQAKKMERAKRTAQPTKTPLYFHTDACQAANYLDLHVARLGVDMMTVNGGKIYGPKQSGVLFVASKITLQPQILGGGQERNLRSGTENVAACIGLAAALELVQTGRHNEAKRLQVLQAQFYTLVAELPGVTINGSRKKRLPNNVHLTIEGQDNERLLIQLDEAGIMAAAGSACSASDEEPSHVLRAIGLSDKSAQSSLRFTMGQSTSLSDVTAVVNRLGNFIS